ncbi:MAG: hypothetical protein R6U98_01415, partial [Pirellulaceae bacterium]
MLLDWAGETRAHRRRDRPRRPLAIVTGNPLETNNTTANIVSRGKDSFRNKWRIWRGEDKTGKEGEAGVLDYTSMQPDAVQSPPQLAINL